MVLEGELTSAQRTSGRPLPEDFERIFNENQTLVYRVAYRITGSNEDAEDVLQTLFLRLLRREILPDMERNPKAYMHRAAINIALDIVKLRARNVSTGNIEDHLPHNASPTDRLPAFRIQDWLRDALGELNPRAAEIFVLKHVEGYDNAEIAKTLGVSYVVEGSVQRVGGRVRVTAQLIDARNDSHVWSEHYDRDFSDKFAIQSEIAQRIADQLRAKLSVEEKAAITERPTTDLVAYAYYTKAKELDLTENWEGDERNMKQKLELLEKATQQDPNFALAYCEIAMTHHDLMSMLGYPEAHSELELAKKAAETALRFGDIVAAAESFTDAAWVAKQVRDGTQALRFVARARELTSSPRLSEVDRARLLARLPG